MLASKEAFEHREKSRLFLKFRFDNRTYTREYVNSESFAILRQTETNTILHNRDQNAEKESVDDYNTKLRSY